MYKGNTITRKLEEILSVLLVNSNILPLDKKLISLNKDEILTPIGDVLPQLSNQKSKLDDQFIDMNLLKEFIKKLKSKGSLIRINHVGFCYKVDSQKDEKERIKNLISNTKLHLYEETSNDAGLWLFVGNLKNWQNPLIELLPVEKTKDKWVDYWLPHIQIDVDTNLNEEEIKRLDLAVFGKKVLPFPISIEGITYVVRNRLGTVGGVNIILDLATSSRKVKYHREKILKMVN